jgi:hypothetical protein
MKAALLAAADKRDARIFGFERDGRGDGLTSREILHEPAVSRRARRDGDGNKRG